jgi:hypothetical protein
MRNIDQSEWMGNPQLDIIEKGKNEDERKFSLRAMQESKAIDDANAGARK